jgi:hypothetical protein
LKIAGFNTLTWNMLMLETYLLKHGRIARADQPSQSKKLMQGINEIYLERIWEIGGLKPRMFHRLR